MSINRNHPNERDTEMAKRRSNVELVRRNTYYKRLKVLVLARAELKRKPLSRDLAIAYTIADLYHLCDELTVSGEIAHRLGVLYYEAEVRGSLR